jgi:hypothetical protein
MATLSQVGIAGVGTGVLHPKHKNRWRAIFAGLGGVSGASAGVPNDLSLQVVTVTRPNLNFEEVQLDRYNSRVYVAGKHTFEPMQLTVEDDVTNRATIAVQTQLESQQRLIGATGPWLNTAATASAYKFSIQLEQLDGNETVVETWVYEGCYIQSADYGEGDYATGEKMMINLTIRYDLTHQILVPAVTGSALGGFAPGS